MFTGVTLKPKFARAETLLQDVSTKLEELTEKLLGIHFKPFCLLIALKNSTVTYMHAMIIAVHVFTCTRL